MDLDRRDFLRLSGLAVGAQLLPLGLARAALAQDKKKGATKATNYKTKHVVLVAFAGGVRTKDTLGTPENIPNLRRIAQQGTTLSHVATRPAIGHYGAALSIFTGQVEERASKDEERTGAPTIFEYVRKQRELDSRDVWLSVSGGDQQLNFAYGTHNDYGAKYGATIVSQDGQFATELKTLVDHLGRPRADDPKDRDKLDELRRALDEDSLKKAPGTELGSDPESRSRMERVIVEELSAQGLKGNGAGDARAIRAAKAVLATFRPTLTGIALSNADVGHGNFASYVEVIKRNDVELGALWNAVQADPELKGTTSLIVLPEFGRDKDLNQRQGLDHTDSSKDTSEVACFAIGPDFKQNAVVTEEVRWTQICPTICELLGCSADKTKEKPIKSIFAS